jgi:hypothetical protein
MSGRSGLNGKGPEELRRAALAKYDRKVVHLETLHNEVLKVIDELIQRAKASLFEGLAYKADSVSRDSVEILAKLTAALNSATDSQVRLDKTAEVRKNAMSHEEQKKALADWVLSWPGNAERADWIRELAKRHDQVRSGNVTTTNSLELGPTLKGVRDDGTSN